MVKRIPDPAEAWGAWHNDNNSIQRVARQVVPAPLVAGAPYPHAHTLGAIRQAQAIVDGGGDLLAPELVTNGGFDTATDWTLGAGWSIAAGVAVSLGSAGNLSQSLAVIEGKTYRVEFDVLNGIYLATLDVVLAGTAVAAIVADNSYSFDVVAGAGAAEISFQVAVLNNFSGDVDNVSVRELVNV